jgi:hypothetical protein
MEILLDKDDPVETFSAGWAGLRRGRCYPNSLVATIEVQSKKEKRKRWIGKNEDFRRGPKPVIFLVLCVKRVAVSPFSL